MTNKQYWLLKLDGRRKHFLYKKREFEAAKTVREMIELIEQDKIKDYSILESFGIDVEMPLTTGFIQLT